MWAYPLGDRNSAALSRHSSPPPNRALSMTGDAARSGLSSGYSRANSASIASQPGAQSNSRARRYKNSLRVIRGPWGEGESARIDSAYGRTCRGLACRLSGVRGGAKQFRPSIQSPRAVGSDVASLQDNSALTSQAYKTTQTARIACSQTAGRPIPPSKRLRLASEKTSARPPVSKPCLSLWTRWRSGLRLGDNPVYDTEGQK